MLLRPFPIPKLIVLLILQSVKDCLNFELYIVRGCLLVVEFCDYFGVLYSVGVCTCTCNRLCE